MHFLSVGKHLWRVWIANTRASVIREMEFRANFFMGIVRQVLWFGVFIIFIDALFANTNSLVGWSQQEMLVVLALSRIIEGLMSTLFVHNWMNFTQTVNTGEFDFYLVKPLPVQFYTAFRLFKLDNIGNILAGVGLLFYAFGRLATPPSAFNVLYFFILLLAGIVIYHSLLVIVASLVFRLQRLESLHGFNTLFSEPLTVPFDLFPGSVRLVLTYLVPIAFVVFIPAEFLIGRGTFWHLPVGLGLAVLFVLFANQAWRVGLKKYSSASS